MINDVFSIGFLFLLLLLFLYNEIGGERFQMFFFFLNEFLKK